MNTSRPARLHHTTACSRSIRAQILPAGAGEHEAASLERAKLRPAERTARASDASARVTSLVQPIDRSVCWAERCSCQRRGLGVKATGPGANGGTTCRLSGASVRCGSGWWSLRNVRRYDEMPDSGEETGESIGGDRGGAQQVAGS